MLKVVKTISIARRRLVLCPGLKELVCSNTEPFLALTGSFSSASELSLDGQSVLCTAVGDQMLDQVSRIDEALSIEFIWSPELLKQPYFDLGFSLTYDSLWRRGWSKRIDTTLPGILSARNIQNRRSRYERHDDLLLARFYRELQQFPSFRLVSHLLEQQAVWHDARHQETMVAEDIAAQGYAENHG